jgi:hypothetical protein
MTVVGSPFFLITISSSFATPLSDAQSSQDQYTVTAPHPGMVAATNACRSPRHCNSGQRCFPASNLDKGPGLQCG